MNKLSIEDLDLTGKRILMRVDFNVPIRDGQVDDDQRIVAALPTIRHALAAGASVVLMSHLGRPAGKADPQFSLSPVRACLEAQLDRPVAFVDDCVGAAAEAAAVALQAGQVLLLENLRFHPGEKKPNSEPDFVERLAGLGNVYVNDAFGTAHRAHASMVAVAKNFGQRAAGFLMAREIEYFGQALADPARPFAAILGGAKVSDKIGVIDHLMEIVDVILVGGAMAYTFMKARGVAVGASRVEIERVALAGEILEKVAKRGKQLLLPVDHVCGRTFDAATERVTTSGESIEDGWMGLDIGPRTAEVFTSHIAGAQTVIWNGPLGVFEWEPFAAGTMTIARACAESSALTIVGGGDSASAARRSGLADRFSHISTGGGASLELLEGKQLPGLAVLTDRPAR
jgi:phosphoglycerate kinase